MRFVLIFAFYFFLSSYGLYQLKAAPLGLNIAFFVGFSAYVAGFIIWIGILRLMPLSLAFPIASGGLLVASQLMGYWLLNEHFSLSKWIGVFLIFSGILLLSLKEAS